MAAGKPPRINAAVSGPVRSVLTGNVGCPRADHRRTAAVAGVVETELGVVQAGSEDAGGEAVLVEVAAVAILVARNAAEGAAEIGDTAEAEPDHVAAAGRKIIRRKIRAGRLEFVATKLEQPERFDRDVRGEPDARPSPC